MSGIADLAITMWPAVIYKNGGRWPGVGYAGQGSHLHVAFVLLLSCTGQLNGPIARVTLRAGQNGRWHLASCFVQGGTVVQPFVGRRTGRQAGQHPVARLCTGR